MFTRSMILKWCFPIFFYFLNLCFCGSFAWVQVTSNFKKCFHKRSSILSAVSSDSKGQNSSLLRRYDYDQRLKTIRQNDLPLLAEIYVDGQSTIARLVSFRCLDGEPLAEVELMESNNDSKVIDFGQITTIWEFDDSFLDISEIEPLPAGFMDRKLDLIYYSRVGRARSSSKGLTDQDTGKGMC
jgi:hypothetical protein